MNCKSVSVMKEPSSFLLQTNFIWLVVLSANYWIYDFNDTRSLFFSFCCYFRIVGLFWTNLTLSKKLIAPVGLEICSMNHWQSLQRKGSGLNGFETFFSHFSTEFLVFACFCCCFHSHKTCCDVWSITYEIQTSLSSHGVLIERIFLLLLKASDFNGF